MEDARVNDKSLTALSEFLTYVEPQRLSRNLRGVLLEYLACECENLDADFKVFAEDLNFLFRFLDEVAENHPPAP